MEQALNYFAVFGGLDVDLNMNKPLRSLIVRHILNEYYPIKDYIAKLTKNSAPYHKILTGIALGDRRTTTAFKRADIEYHEGMNVLYELEELEIIKTETSIDHVTNKFEENEVEDRLLFNAPFLRFWFAFVSPLYRGVAREEYDECFERFNNYHAEFMALTYEQLCHEYVKELYKDDNIEDIGRFWDDKEHLDLVAQSESGKVIIGSCRYTNSKMKKSELTRLKELCEKLEIVPAEVMLFSKRGFTNELKELKGEGLRLFTVKSLKALLA